MKWTIIRNPNAAGGKGLKVWPKLRQILIDANIDFDDLRTDYPRHAIQLTQEAIANGARNIIAMGGDGTVNEVANGILGQSYCNSKDILFTQIPIGTGNDWSRTMNIPKDLKKIPAFLHSATEQLQDVGLLSWMDEREREQQRYFVNMAGMGFDAYVGKIADAKKAKGKSGAMAYISALLAGLFSYKTVPVGLNIDSEKKGDFSLFSMSVGICRYSGGGMMQCPEAIFDDGIFDLTLIDKISKIKVLMNIPRLYSGSFVHNKEVYQFKGNYIEIEAGKELLLEVDGEVVGAGNALLTLLPKELKVLKL